MNDTFSPSLMRQCQLNNNTNKVNYSNKVSHADKTKGNPSSKETNALNSFLKGFKIMFSLQL